LLDRPLIWTGAAIKETAHNPHIEKPQEINALLQAFLQMT